MILSEYKDDELSVDSGQPIELYMFGYNKLYYTYTSSRNTIMRSINGTRYSFNPEYIFRGDSLTSSTNNNTNETYTITVSRLNPVAMLFQSSPPEQDTVSVDIYRIHGEDSEDMIQLLHGVISQVSFEGSDATITVTSDSLLARTIPKGTLSYFCQNCIYDSKCQLNQDDYAHTCYVDIGMYSTVIYSTNLREKPSGYFTDGYVRMGNSYRAVLLHKDNMIKLKYPINEADVQGSFVAYPGCSNIFSVCASRFGNTDNFSGIPYVKPYNPYTHVVGGGAYWINSSVIIRDTHGFVYE